MGKRRLTTWIDRREALPVRAIPFITGWNMPPDKVAAVLAHDDLVFRTIQGEPIPLTAYHLVNGKPHLMPAKAWDNIQGTMATLASNLVAEAWDDATKIAEPHHLHENTPCPEIVLSEWLALSSEERDKRLFDACRGDDPNANIRQVAHELSRDIWVQEAVKRLPAGVFVWRDEFEMAYHRAYANVLIADERPGDRVLDFSPWLPKETQQVAIEGFVDYIPRPVEQGRLVEDASEAMPTTGLAEATPAESSKIVHRIQTNDDGKGSVHAKFVNEVADEMEKASPPRKVTENSMWSELAKRVGKSIIVDSKPDCFLCEVGEPDTYRLTKGSIKGILERRRKKARQEHG